MVKFGGLIGGLPSGCILLGSPDNVWSARQNSGNRAAYGQSQRKARGMRCRCEAESLYEVLGVCREATKEDIKSSYRRLARVFHPDAANSSAGKDNSTQHFIKIHTAYATLSNPQTRAQYDRRYSSNVSYPRQFAGRKWETDQCW